MIMINGDRKNMIQFKGEKEEQEIGDSLYESWDGKSLKNAWPTEAGTGEMK